MSDPAPEAVPEAAPEVVDVPAPAEPEPPTIKGTIQTTLELAFPELYKAVLLPSDVVNQRKDAEAAAEEEYQFQIKQRELRKTERAEALAKAEADRIAAAEAAEAQKKKDPKNSKPSTPSVPPADAATTEPEAEEPLPEKATVPEFVLPTLPDEFSVQRQSIQGDLDRIVTAAALAEGSLSQQYKDAVAADAAKELDLYNSTGLIAAVDVPRARPSLAVDHNVVGQNGLINFQSILNKQDRHVMDVTLPKDPRAFVKATPAKKPRSATGSITSSASLGATSPDLKSSIPHLATLNLETQALGPAAAGGNTVRFATDVKPGDVTQALQSPANMTTAAQVSAAQKKQQELAEKEAARKERMRIQSLKTPYDEMEANLKILTRMRNRIDFLKNPRYADTSTLRRVGIDAPVLEPTDPRRFFRVDPEVVVFTDYEPGQTLELAVLLYNDTSIGRPVRVLPPKSDFFSLHDIVFPAAGGESNIVAPGMAARAMVRFKPNSLADFDDTITVLTEGGQFLVDVRGRRAPPVLSLPAVLDCGRCLVDERVHVSFACSNAGGIGRFQLLPADHPSLKQFLPANLQLESMISAAMRNSASRQSFRGPQFTSFHPQQQDGGMVAPSWQPDMDGDDDDESISVQRSEPMVPLDEWLAADEGHMPPFSIAPTQFALGHGEEMEFQITFQPSGVRAFKRDFVLLCDNNQVYPFTLAGQGWDLNVSITSVDGALLGSRPPLRSTLPPPADDAVPSRSPEPSDVEDDFDDTASRRRSQKLSKAGSVKSGKSGKSGKSAKSARSGKSSAMSVTSSVSKRSKTDDDDEDYEADMPEGSTSPDAAPHMTAAEAAIALFAQNDGHPMIQDMHLQALYTDPVTAPRADIAVEPNPRSLVFPATQVGQMQRSKKTVAISNASPVPVPFHWAVWKRARAPPILGDAAFGVMGQMAQAIQQHLSESVGVNLEETGQMQHSNSSSSFLSEADAERGDESDVFFVEPASGVIPAFESTEFTFYFVPTAVQECHAQANFVVEEVPRTMLDRMRDQQDAADSRASLSVVNSVKTLQSNLSDLKLNNRGVTADMFLDLPVAPDHVDMVLMDVNLQGVCAPVQVEVAPLALVVSAPLSRGLASAHEITLINRSDAPARFSFGAPLCQEEPRRRPNSRGVLPASRPHTSVTSAATAVNRAISPPTLLSSPSTVALVPESMLDVPLHLDFDQSNGVLAPGSSQTIAVSVTGLKLGSHTVRVPVSIDNGTTLSFNVTATIVGPRVVIRTAGIDFGLLNFGVPNVSEQSVLTLENLSDIPAAFSLCESGFAPLSYTDGQDENVEAAEGGVLSFYPGIGVLPPRACRDLTVIFRPHACQRLRSVIEVHARDSEPRHVSVRAEVQAPQVVVRPHTHAIGTSYVGVPRTIQLSLVNLSNLPALFRWEDIDSAACGFRACFHPRTGELSGKSEQEITLELTAFQPGKLDRVLACDMEGAPEPLGLSVSTEVRPLLITPHMSAAAKVRALMAEYAAAVKVSSNENAPRTGTARPKSVRIVEPVAATEDAFPPPPADKPADSSDPAQPAEGANEASESPAAVPEPEPEVETVDPAAEFHAKLLEMGAPVEQEDTLRAYEEAYPRNVTVSVIDFGDDCTINSQRTLTLVLRNHSAVPTTFSLAAVTMNAGNEEALNSLLQGVRMPGHQPEADTALRSGRQSTPGSRPGTNMSSTSHGSGLNSRASSRPGTGLELSGKPITSGADLVKALTAKWSRSQAATMAATAGKPPQPLLSTAHETLLRFQSKQGQTFIQDKIKEEKMRGILRTGQGVAFAFEPPIGFIEPWNVVEVKVHMFAGMCGRYSDEAILRLGDAGSESAAAAFLLNGAQLGSAPEQRLRLRVGVLGSPLRLSHDTIGLSFAHGAKALIVPPTLRFHGGPLPAQSGVYERRVKLENTGPFDLKLKWHVYDETPSPLIAIKPVEPAAVAAVESAEGDQSSEAVPPSPAHSVMTTKSVQPHVQPAVVKDVVTVALSLAPTALRALTDPNEQGAPIVQLVINPVEADADFVVRVPQPEVVIKARSHTHMSVQFCAEAPGQCVAYLRAETMLRAGDREKVQAPATGRGGAGAADEVIEDPNAWIAAPAVLANSPLEFFASGSTIAVGLTLDRQVDGEGGQTIEYAIRASPKVRAEQFVQQAPLVNHSGTTLDFTLTVEPAEYFALVGVESSALSDKPLARTAAAFMTTFSAPPAPLPLGGTGVKSTKAFSATGSVHSAVSRGPQSIAPSQKQSEAIARSSKAGSKAGSTVAHSTAGSMRSVKSSSSAATAAPEIVSSVESNAISQRLYSLPTGAHASVGIQMLAPSVKNTRVWPIGPVPQVLDGQLCVHYANGHRQQFALRAKLYRPVLLVAPHELGDDAKVLRFPFTHVDDRVSFTLPLINPSHVDANWTLVHVREDRPAFISTMAPQNLRSLSNPEFHPHRERLDDPQAFTFSELEGCVPALSLPASATPGIGYQLNATSGAQPAWDQKREPQQLRVFFKPKVEGEYHCRFRFQVSCGESIDIELYGIGTYDEQHRARV